jgi:hypothetical protein
MADKVQTVMMRGKRYKLRVVPNLPGRWGDCSPPSLPNRTIRIVAAAKDQRELETLVHEFLHACYDDLDEAPVEQGARDIARALWRMGYRRT